MSTVFTRVPAFDVLVYLADLVSCILVGLNLVVREKKLHAEKSEEAECSRARHLLAELFGRKREDVLASADGSDGRAAANGMEMLFISVHQKRELILK